MTSNFLFVNPKWKNTDVYEALSSKWKYFIKQKKNRFFLNYQFQEIQFKCLYDESLNLVDFKAGCTGFCYIQNSKDVSNTECRKHLAKVNNVN